MSTVMTDCKPNITAFHLTRKLEALTERIDQQQMSALMQDRNPVKTLRYLYDAVLGS